MPLVRNKSDQPHRYPLWGIHSSIVWQPGETKEVSSDVAAHVCQVHPDKLERVTETENPEAPRRRRAKKQEPAAGAGTEIFDASLPRSSNRQQRGGRRS